MKMEYADLSKQGLIYCPREIEAGHSRLAKNGIEFLVQDRDFPEIIGDVPNLAEFSCGIDCHIGAFEIKEQDSRHVKLPTNIAFLLPATTLISDHG